jgi:hypothetical protein
MNNSFEKFKAEFEKFEDNLFPAYVSSVVTTEFSEQKSLVIREETKRVKASNFYKPILPILTSYKNRLWNKL